MKKWITVEGFGDLYKEMILVMFDVPILFVCKDEKNIRWLALCEDEETGEYLLAKCQKEELLKMVNRISSVDEVINNANEFNYISYDFEQEQFQVKKIQNDEITEEMLPDKGTYLKINNNIEEYGKKLAEEGFTIQVLSKKKRLANNLIIKSISSHAETTLRPYIKINNYFMDNNILYTHQRVINNKNYRKIYELPQKGELICKVGVN